MKGKITMDDVLREVDRLKGELTRALMRRGLAQLQLNNVANLVESGAARLVKLLREDPRAAAPVLNIDVRPSLDAYLEEQREVDECVAKLRTLRVPEAEIDKLMRG